MNRIKIKVGAKGETITANEEVFNGFYIVYETKIVIKNNKVLGINFDPYATNTQTRISKFEDFSFLTVKVNNEYTQNILSPDIDRTEFYDYLKELEEFPEMQNLLIVALNQTGRIFLG
jgi:hypothetical protein